MYTLTHDDYDVLEIRELFSVESQMIEGTAAFCERMKKDQDSGLRPSCKNKRNEKIPLRDSGPPGGKRAGRKNGRKEGRKEGTNERRVEGSMTTACWQFFKESVCHLTGMNNPPLPPPICRSPSFSSSLFLLRPTIREGTKERESGTLRDHATTQDLSVIEDGFCV